MRKFNLLSVLLFITLSTAFISCSKDDDPTIVGKWELVKHEYNEFHGETSVDVVDKGDGTETMFLNADGTGVANGTISCTWTLEGTKLTIKYMDEDKEESFTMEVQKLTNDELVLYATYKDGPYDFYDRQTFKKI